MSAFYGFVLGFVIGAPIWMMFGADLERSRARNGGGWR